MYDIIKKFANYPIHVKVCIHKVPLIPVASTLLTFSYIVVILVIWSLVYIPFVNDNEKTVFVFSAPPSMTLFFKLFTILSEYDKLSM